MPPADAPADAMRSAGALIFVKCRKYDPHVRLLLSGETQHFFFFFAPERLHPTLLKPPHQRPVCLFIS